MATVALDRAGSRIVAEATTDRELIRAFLDRDRLYAAYALADLEDRDTGRARWAVARLDGEVVALVLEYGGPSPQPLFIVGSDEGIDEILRDVIRPSIAYVACLPGEPRRGGASLPPRAGTADGPDVGRPNHVPTGGSIRASSGSAAMDVGELNRLYRLGFGSWLPPSAIARGRVLRDQGQRPAGRGRRDARHRA